MDNANRSQAEASPSDDTEVPWLDALKALLKEALLKESQPDQATVQFAFHEVLENVCARNVFRYDGHCGNYWPDVYAELSNHMEQIRKHKIRRRS